MNHFQSVLKLAFGFLIVESGLLRADTGTETNLALNRAAYQSSAINYDDVAHLATDGSRDTFWQSKVEDQPWIYVDLGGLRKIRGVKLDWGQFAPASCTIQISTDVDKPVIWTDVAHLSCAASQVSDVSFAAVDAHFVRMIADAGAAPGGCQLNEFEVDGEAPPSPPPPDLNLPAKDGEGKTSLDGMGWKLQNTLFNHDSGEDISKPSYSSDSWLPAKVPATVLTSYLLDGAIPDPNFGDQQHLISESFFQNDFWYRKEFLAPAILPHQHFLLNFEGINWKADIYLNGSQVGHIDGAFMRGNFDITGKLLPEQKNVLAVLIHKCANPGPTNEKSLKHGPPNGGVLGKDSPTFLASIGWNWMPSIRGRDIGIWDHVYLQQVGPVILVDPFIQTTLSRDLHQADLTLQVTIRNLENMPEESVLTGSLGNVSFTQTVPLAANETKTLVLDKTSFPQLSLNNPQLWWPNGYGQQPLQHLHLTLAVNGSPSFQKEVVFGIRQLTYDDSDKILKIFCNGQRIQLMGGNWGMDESMLRYEAKDYDTAVRLHKEMNMTMIRNWVGQVGKEEFFDACDKYGLLVWNDFWLASPFDGNNPDDPEMFMANVRDRIARIRNHPSLALYCGRNEGSPPPNLDQGLREETAALDGTRHYISDSKRIVVTGSGPYEPHSVSWYFNPKNQATTSDGDLGIGITLHSELGIVTVPTADSMRLMMPEKDLWPISDMWALHDFFQDRCHVYTKRINRSYGPSQGIDEFCEKAQMHNLENAKAMFETWRSNSGSGCLVWMSHPAWPSLICQFYDYYLNPTAAYFGAKKANEPLHILWDAFTNQIKVANNTGKSFANLHAKAWIYNMDGTQQAYQHAQINSGADGVATDCFQLNFPDNLTPVHFIKLKLTDGDHVVSENFYWRGLKEDGYLTLNDMPKVGLTGSYTESDANGKTSLDVHLENPSDQVALMVCLKVVRATAPQERILPIFYDDNYVSMLPQEKRDIHIEFDSALLKGGQSKIMADGWNVPSFELTHRKAND